MRRSRATYRPTVTPVGSTHVDSFTGTTSSKVLHGPLNLLLWEPLGDVRRPYDGTRLARAKCPRNPGLQLD